MPIANDVRIDDSVPIPHPELVNPCRYAVGVRSTIGTVILIDDHNSRALVDGYPETPVDWGVTATLVRRGASTGGGAVTLRGVRIAGGSTFGVGAVAANEALVSATLPGRIICLPRISEGNGNAR